MPTRNPTHRRLSERLVGGIVYPLWARRDHPAYARYRQQFERSQYVPAEQLAELQLGLLQRQIAHAYEHVPYYRDAIKAAGILPGDVRTLADYARFPLLTKRDLQQYKDAMLADDVPPGERVANQTGGSTGSPLQFWVDKERFDSRRASTDRHNVWAGLHPGDWCAVLWGSTFDVGQRVVPAVTWRQRLLERTVTLNTSMISAQALEEFVGQIRRYRPRYLKAYAQSADMFARYCEDNGVRDVRFEGIITSAEVLLPEARARVERVLGPVFNRYGCREVSVIASECDQHSGLHVNADALLVELVPQLGAPEGVGRVVVTDLLNRSMPLLRYEIGDLARWAGGEVCACGRALPRLEAIEGRITDFLERPDGSLISGPSLALLVGQIAEIAQAQFVQREASRVTLRVVPREGYGEGVVQELRRRLAPYFAEAMTLEIVEVPEIAKEPSGKYRFIKREPPV